MLKCVGGPCDGLEYKWKGCETLMTPVAVRNEGDQQIMSLAIYDLVRDRDGKPSHYRFVPAHAKPH